MLIPGIPRLLVLAFFLLLPFVGNLYLVNQFTLLLVYGMFAMSLSLLWGYVGLLCFGHAVFFGLGAYIMAMVTKQMIPGMDGILSSSLAGILAAVGFNALFALILGWFLFYGRLSGPYLGIVTLAISVLVERIFINWYYTGGYNGISSVPALSFAGWEFSDPRHLYLLVFVLSLCAYLFLRRVVNSPFGAIISAIKHNEARAESFGFHATKYKIKVFAIGASVAGLAGALFAAAAEFVSPTELGFKMSTEVLIWTALGGREGLIASFMGAVTVKLLENYLSEALSEYWVLIIGFIFLLSVIFFPQGLFGRLLENRNKGWSVTSPQRSKTKKEGRVC